MIALSAFFSVSPVFSTNSDRELHQGLNSIETYWLSGVTLRVRVRPQGDGCTCNTGQEEEKLPRQGGGRIKVQIVARARSKCHHGAAQADSPGHTTRMWAKDLGQ